MQKSLDWQRMNNKGTMEQKNKILPELRFPEFMKDGEWKEKSIEKVLIESRIPSIENDVNKRITVRLNLKGIEKREVRGTESENATYFFQRKKGQFIYGKQNLHKGAFGLIPEELDGYESSQDIPSFDFNDGFSPEFFVQYLSQENIYTQLEKISTGTGSKRIHPKDFYKVKYPFPKNINEQQKIAYCLSSLDELITAHNDKLESLKNHKKGLLQNLFPQENQKIPNYRFPEFVNDGEWEEKKFSNYIKLYRGSSPRPIQEYLTNDENGVNWIKIGDAKNAINSIISKVEEKITKKGSEKSRKVKKGELILANSMSFGKTYEIAIDGCIYDGWFVLREYEKYFYKPFLLQFLNSNYMQNQYEKLSAGGIVQNISSDIVYNTIIFYTSLAEQKKIADCLLAVDNLITAQTEKIEQLKAHKKGLMQGLFPKIEE